MSEDTQSNGIPGHKNEPVNQDETETVQDNLPDEFESLNLANDESVVNMDAFDRECPDLGRLFNEGKAMTSKFKIDLKWNSIFYKIPVDTGKEKTYTQILNNISGRVQPGEVVGIMGSSGSGKTSLLNVLAGRISVGEITGDIRVNERKRGNYWRKLIGYVEQSDIMHGKLTVRETIMYSALLRLPNSMSRKDKMSRVDAVIAQLGLTHVQDSFVGDDETRGVSGGERKRVAIGIELVTNPRLIFLDEPTSGLDAFTAYNLIESLSELAKKDDKTVLLTIHQPRSNILDLFDKILLLSKGQVVFFGPAKDALEHFDSLGYKCPNLENPADFFLDITAIDYRSKDAESDTKKRIEEFAVAWEKKGPLYKEKPLLTSEATKKKVGRMPFWSEVFLLLQRNIRLLSRDKQLLRGSIIQSFVFIFFFGFVFFQVDQDQAGIQNRIGVLFILAINTMFNTVMPLVLVFPIVKTIIIRERYASTYRVLSVYIAQFLSSLPLRFVIVTVIMSALYWMIGLKSNVGSFFTYLGILYATSVCAIAIGLTIGSASKNPKQSQIFAPLFLVVFLLFGGNFANNETITWVFRWLQYLSIIFYSYGALFQNEFKGQVFSCNGSECTTGFTTGEQLIEVYGISIGILVSVVALLALSLGFSVLGYLFLRKTTQPKLKLI